MLVRATLRSDVRAPHAEVSFITAFVHEGSDLQGAAGYCLACFQAAAEAAATLSLDELLEPMTESPASTSPTVQTAHACDDPDVVASPLVSTGHAADISQSDTPTAPVQRVRPVDAPRARRLSDAIAWMMYEGGILPELSSRPPRLKPMRSF
jgi:hypothetical protein